MSLLIQHGHGKSDKIDRVLAVGDATGVIYGPRNERPENLLSYIRSVSEAFPGVTQIVDPQFYASTVIGGNLGRLPDYPYFRSELHYRNFIASSEIIRIVHSAIDFQAQAPISHFCSPTVSVDSFNDRWNSVALNLAAESVSYHRSLRDGRPLLVSILIHEQALRSAAQLDEFLDVITDFDCAGFYLILRHESANFSQAIDARSLAGLLYATYVLGHLNDFEVIAGYSDYVSLLLHAVGARATACGWNFGLRRFSFARFEPQAGGRRAKSRYSSSPLLNSIPVTPELDTIARVGEMRSVLSRSSYDGGFGRAVPSAVTWDEITSALHHWQVLSRSISAVEASGNMGRRLAHVETAMAAAQAVYSRLQRFEVPFEPSAGPGHLAEWLSGVREFRTHAGI